MKITKISLVSLTILSVAASTLAAATVIQDNFDLVQSTTAGAAGYTPVIKDGQPALQDRVPDMGGSSSWIANNNFYRVHDGQTGPYFYGSGSPAAIAIPGVNSSSGELLLTISIANVRQPSSDAFSYVELGFSNQTGLTNANVGTTVFSTYAHVFNDGVVRFSDNTEFNFSEYLNSSNLFNTITLDYNISTGAASVAVNGSAEHFFAGSGFANYAGFDLPFQTQEQNTADYTKLTSFSVASVPEPSVWAAMVFGLLLLPLFRRLSRSQPSAG